MKKMSKVSVLGAMIAMAVSMMPMSASAEFNPFDTPLVDGGVYGIISTQSGKAVDIKDSATWNGAGAIQWDYYFGKNQLWKAVYQGDGFYKFINYNSGKVLEVPGGDYTQGRQLVQWQNTDSFGQKWGLLSRKKETASPENLYTIHNKMTRQVMNVAGASTNNGAWIIQWPFQKYSTIFFERHRNQEFVFERRY